MAFLPSFNTLLIVELFCAIFNCFCLNNDDKDTLNVHFAATSQQSKSVLRFKDIYPKEKFNQNFYKLIEIQQNFKRIVKYDIANLEKKGAKTLTSIKQSN